MNSNYIEIIAALKVFLMDYIENFSIQTEIEDFNDEVDDGNQLLSVSQDTLNTKLRVATRSKFEEIKS